MISGRKLLLVTVRVVGILGCAGINVNNAETVKEGTQKNIVDSKECHCIQMFGFVDLFMSTPMVMLGVLLLSAFLSILTMLVALLWRVFTCGQGQGHGQGHGVRAECTCADTQQVSCRRHDYSLLWELSRNLPNEDHLFGIGLYLHVDNTEIEASRVDNKSIIRAVYVMLCKWYRTQDGLGQNSNGLEELKRALYRNNVGSYVQTVIQKHFDER